MTGTSKSTSGKAGSKPRAVASGVKRAAGATASTPISRKSVGLQAISAETRLQYIEVAAYFIAEKQGFSSDPSQNWLVAEQQIDSQLLSGK